MIGSVRGVLVDREPAGEVLVEAAGVGYRVLVTPAALASLGQTGGEVFLWTHHHVREEAHALYGFPTKEERATFEALLGAHGVGPALALAILSVHGPAALRRAVGDDDLDALCLVPGVGRKTAARLVLELKSRLGEVGADVAVPAVGGSGAPTGTPLDDVRDALSGLGYGTEEIRAVLGRLPAEGDPALLVREALQLLASVRA